MGNSRARLKTISSMPMGFIKLARDVWIPIDDIHLILDPSSNMGCKMRASYRRAGRVLNFAGKFKMRSMLLVLPTRHLLLSHHTTLHIINELQAWYTATRRG